MNGEVTSWREVIFQIRLKNLQSDEVEIDAVLDTGFDDYLTLPRVLIEELALPQTSSMPIVLADDSVTVTSVHQARIFWHDRWKTINVQATEASTLIGMRLIYGSIVTLEVIDGGSATIEALDNNS